MPRGSEAFGTFWTAPPYLRAAQYDEAVLKENKLPTLSSRPTDSVVRTISDLLEGHARRAGNVEKETIVLEARHARRRQAAGCAQRQHASTRIALGAGCRIAKEAKDKGE